MSEPTTPTGKRMMGKVFDLPGEALYADRWQRDILAIEAEAAAKERERLQLAHNASTHAGPGHRPFDDPCGTCRLLADPEPDR